MTMLNVQDLGVSIGSVAPLSGVSFQLERGEIIGIVGESGSGKSLTAMGVMGLLPLIGGQVDHGTVEFDGIELTKLSENEYRKLRGGRIGLITQNPMTSLDPLMKIGPQVDAVSRLHLGLDKAGRKSAYDRAARRPAYSRTGINLSPLSPSDVGRHEATNCDRHGFGCRSRPVDCR